MKNLSILFLSFFFLSFQAFAQYNANPELASTETSRTEVATAEITTSEMTIADMEATETITPKVIVSQLTVSIVGLDSDEGTLMIAVYASEGEWLSKNLFGKSSAIVNGTATVVFEDVPVGTYGISTYHDENDNNKLDTRIFGIPREPYASSRGAKGRFGPPQWNDAKFELTEDAHTEEIKY